MLISRKHNFIFIHIYKTAGSSITRALGPYAMGRFKYHVFTRLNRIGISLGSYAYPAHISASELQARMGKDVFRSYFTFAIVRNPWDWQVSFYTYVLKFTGHFQHALIASFKDFDEYIKWACAQKVKCQKDFIFSEEGEQLVDFIGRYERLDDDFRYICSRINITAQLPRINVSKTRRYQDFYTAETRELVRRTYAPDIELFGYNFE